MLIVKGAFEVPLVRLLDQERYATELANEGRARLTRIDLFREMEAPRGDQSEGIGRLARQEVPFVKWGGATVQASVEVVTEAPVYILCFHDDSADLQRLAGPRKYGVRIEDPAALNAALPGLTAELPHERHIVSLRVGQVQYDKNGLRHLPTFHAAFPLAFLQKEPRFANEKEWRLALFLSDSTLDSPEFINISIPFSTRLQVFEL